VEAEKERAGLLQSGLVPATVALAGLVPWLRIALGLQTAVRGRVVTAEVVVPTAELQVELASVMAVEGTVAGPGPVTRLRADKVVLSPRLPTMGKASPTAIPQRTVAAAEALGRTATAMGALGPVRPMVEMQTGRLAGAPKRRSS